MDVMFHAVVGHELVHAYNILTLGASNWAKPGATDFSENAAYEYSYKVFLKAGMFSDAAASFQSMQNYPTAPSQYSNLPPFLANP